MKKLSNYYKDLPQGFKEDYRIDAKKGSFILVFNLVSALLMILAGGAIYLLRFGTGPLYEEEVGGKSVAIALLIIIIGYFVYLVLHELTHGVCYKLLTKQKLKFGLTLFVAYCGLKEGYVNKKTALISILAPFVVHSVWMLLAIFLIAEPIISVALIVLFALHFGGCVGDLWGTCILLFKYARKPVLMSDSGPCQIFYTYSDEPTEVVTDNPQTEEQPVQSATDDRPPEDSPTEEAENVGEE